MTLRTCLTFDDVSVVPNYSDLSSRSEVDLSLDCGWMTLTIPILSAPMDTCTGLDMIRAMRQAGGDGIHHRYCDSSYLRGVAYQYPVAVSPSVGLDFVKRVIDGSGRYPVLVIDVAHGDSKPALDYAEACVKLGAIVVSGNIVTWRAAQRYIDVGVNIMRVGLGNGSACTTRRVAGVGIPQFSALQDICGIFDDDVKAISDGGLRDSGDIVKALAIGADAVMTGLLLAPATEALGTRTEIDGKLFKEYAGMASGVVLDRAGKEHHVEGVSGLVECGGSVSSIMEELATGMRMGFAYVGARNVSELRQKAEFVQVTHAGLVEGMPRI